MKALVKLIAGVRDDGVIGNADHSLPFKSSRDMKRFKELTSGHHVIMGRVTFDTLKRPGGLPNRYNYVVSRTNSWSAMARLCGSLDQAIQDCHDSNEVIGYPKDIWIIGGASIYKEAIERTLVDEYYLTIVHQPGEVHPAQVHFPVSLDVFMLSEGAEIVHEPATETDPALTFLTVKQPRSA
jgi:dihydrofolate reductase